MLISSLTTYCNPDTNPPQKSKLITTGSSLSGFSAVFPTLPTEIIDGRFETETDVPVTIKTEKRKLRAQGGTMVGRQSIFKGIFFALLGIVCFFNQAYAYLDPGTGSLILQTAVAIFLGALFTLKLWWQRLKNLISRRSKEKTYNDSQ